MSKVSPFAAGLKGRCPRCGEGQMFAGYLRIADHCDVCELDYSFADAGDGPAVFVMFPAGFAVVIPALLLEVAAQPPIWVHMVLWLPLTLLICLLLLRPFKGVLFALQYKHAAEEARFNDKH
ncbi:DUF983 domain-containing protein [Hyphobacterium sp.]|jgi:uncharacterized protein (DUF983 family)|uniref:DUF983 domain-containing protein n=1 Tax=Hyphobacterium sp. TaxID=2004662 RepID=UPI003BA9F986